MRRVIVMAVGVVLAGLTASMAQAEDRRERGDKVLTGVLSGLMGESPQPAQSADAAYAAQERERLVSLLQGGGYTTSRQGEPVDLMVLGVPLTRAEHVYTAKPIPPSQTGSR